MQLFNVYYRLTIAKPFRFRTTVIKNDIPAVDGAQSFRWLKISGLIQDDFTFPIDKSIVGRIKSDFK
jgi:hypothetical protein